MISVSAIITTCDRTAQGEIALRSVIAQSRQPDNIIVVDDGLRQKFELPPDIQSFGNIELIRTGGRIGACAARNRGAGRAKGDILMFLDDDDSWESNKVNRQLQVYVNDPAAVVVYTGRLVVSANNREKILYKIPAKTTGFVFERMLANNLIGTTSGAAIRGSAFWAVGGFDENQPALNDYDLWIRLAKVGKIVGDEEFNTRYTLGALNGGDSISRGPTLKHREAIRRIQVKYAKDIAELRPKIRRKVAAQHMFLIAKNARVHGWLPAVAPTLRAFLNYPSFKFLLLLLPRNLLLSGRRII